MRIYIIIAMLLFATGITYGQDTLFKVDGTILLTKIIELNQTQVKYKLYSNPEGPTYVAGKEFISQIVYENGVVEIFPVHENANIAPILKIDPRSVDFGRNFISINLFDLLGRNTLTISYEYTFKNGLSSFKVPISIKLDDIDYYDDRKVFGIGLDYYLYPFGQGKSKLFYGPSFEYKKFDSATYFQTDAAYAFLFQAGYLFQPHKNINISIYGGLGYAQIIADFDYGEVATRAGLNLGYKF